MKLTPEQRDKLDTYYQTQDQLKTLQDLADMTHELVNLATDTKENTGKLEALGAIFTDAREQLVKLNEKTAPEAPDYAKPIVAALYKLETAFKAQKAPEVNVEAPNVTVAAPDFTEFNKALEDLPNAFKEAIKLIKIPAVPQTDFTPLLQAWEGISAQLDSIDTATRMKPLPGSMKVTNPDGSLIGGSGGLTDTELRATPVDVVVTSDTYSAVTVDASTSGDTTIVAITNAARLYYISLSANGANSADVTATVSIGASEKFKVSLKAGSIFARNIGAGRRYLTGSSGDDIVVNLSAAQTVHVSVEYEDV